MERRLKIGHTGITWTDEDFETAVATIAKLGYYGVETFGWVLDTLEQQGRSDIFQKYDLPLISSYFSFNLVDPAKREANFEKARRWGGLLLKHKAKTICMGGDLVNRLTFHFAEHRDYIIQTVNELGQLFTDMGLSLCYHPHTGTPIETEYEIRTLVDNMDTRYVGFAPDVAQIQKGGTDAAKIVKDYISIIRHVHLKDYDGVPLRHREDGSEIDSSGFCCYTPLGRGVVDLKSILDTLEASQFDSMVMVELDGGKQTPIPQEEALTISRDYLKSLGYAFRA